MVNVWETSKSKVIAMAVVVALSVSWYASKRPSAGGVQFKAQCSFALVGSKMPTNELRNVALPEVVRGPGPYQDSRIIIKDGLERLLRGGRRSEEALHTFVQSMKNSGVSGHSLTNAFLSADYRMDNRLPNVVHLSTTGETKELALDVMDFVLTNYVQGVEAEDRAREDKALAKLNWDIKRKRESNEDASDLEEQRSRVRRIVGISHRRVVVVDPPHLVE